MSLDIYVYKCIHIWTYIHIYMYINAKVSVHHSPCSLECVLLRSSEGYVHQLRVSSLGSGICSPFEGVLSGSYGVSQHVRVKQGCPCLGSREACVR